MEVRLVKSLKIPLSMLVNCESSANLTDVRPAQPLKTSLPIFVTPDGMVMEVRPEQPLNAPYPIFVNCEPAAKSTDVRPVQPSYLQIALYQRFTS